MAKKNPKIKREFDPKEPGKRLYFYPKHKTVAGSEEEARKKLSKKRVTKTDKAKKPEDRKESGK